MQVVINAKTLRSTLPQVVERVRRGTRFTVVYRSHPAFQIVPLESGEVTRGALEGDPLYRSEALGRSTDGRLASDHDAVLYAG